MTEGIQLDAGRSMTCPRDPRGSAAATLLVVPLTRRAFAALALVLASCGDVIVPPSTASPPIGVSATTSLLPSASRPDPLQPSPGQQLWRAVSTRVERGVPYAIELYVHCGLAQSVIDVDGSLWVDPVFLEGPSELGFNYDRGTITISEDDPNTAVYVTEAGGRVSLTRGPTERVIPICA